jgi:MFS transporter, FHS family, L-fucose permease
MNKTTRPLLLPLILITSLFFLWGMAYGLLDVLNKHFQEVLHIGKRESTLLQAAYFGAYFLMALPAGWLMRKVGYKKGILTGLLLYALGACLFYPAAGALSFPFFLLALFILASGLTFLETAANPFITVLGDPSTSAFRLNLAQSFNGVGSFIGPLIGGMLFFSGKESGAFENVKLVYFAIAAIVLLVALLFLVTKMPEPNEEELVQHHDASAAGRSIFRESHFVGAVIAQFFYVAAQVGVAALFINYCTEKNVGLDNSQSAYYLSVGMIFFTIGRFTGTTLMKFIRPASLLAIYALINVVLCTVITNANGLISIYALVAIFFFESIMFPTIFALGIRDLGNRTKTASSIIIMSIVGGALVPYLMGAIADASSTAHSYTIPMLCFAVVAWYGLSGHKIKA